MGLDSIREFKEKNLRLDVLPNYVEGCLPTLSRPKKKLDWY